MISRAILPRDWPDLRIHAKALESVGIHPREDLEAILLAHHRLGFGLNMINDQCTPVIRGGPASSFAHQRSKALLLRYVTSRLIAL